ncbi:MAG: hypothetical protein QXU18_14445 [Thermoplasmatales archaeon]
MKSDENSDSLTGSRSLIEKISPTNGVGRVGYVLNNLKFFKEKFMSESIKVILEVDLPAINPSDVSVFKSRIYVNDAFDGKLLILNKDNMSFERSLDIPIKHPWGLHITDDHIFITDDIEQEIYCLDKKNYEIEKKVKMNNVDLHGITYKDGKILINDWISKSVLSFDEDLVLLKSEMHQMTSLPDLAGLCYRDGNFWQTDSTLSMIYKYNTNDNKSNYYKGINGHLHGIDVFEKNRAVLVERNKHKLYLISL